MATTPEQPPVPPPPPAAPPVAGPAPEHKHEKSLHEVTFITYPKLLFIWPLIVAGFVLWPLGAPPASVSAAAAVTTASLNAPGPVTTAPAATTSTRLEVIGWIYIWIAIVVLLAMGVDVDRNHAAFWVILVALLWILGVWLRDVKHFTLFGEIYRWFANLNVQYDRGLGLVVSILMTVPYLIMLVWGRFNDRWRITHNEFEHSSFGRLDDSLGRGAKTIRTSYPDVFEMLLGCAGTLVVYNATGTRELRRIPHVLFLPFIRQKLNRILETTSVTASQAEEEEDEETQP